ncbi:MAG: hypothetical protein R6W77_13620 [Trueperaceae bacterium]
MRYLASLLVVTSLLTLGLSRWAVRPQTPQTVELLSIAVPTTVIVGERVALFGGLRLPEGRFEIGAWACQRSGCRRVAWGQVEGPEERWGGLGTVGFESDLGTAWIELRVFERDTVAERVVAAWRRDVTVIPAPGSL